MVITKWKGCSVVLLTFCATSRAFVNQFSPSRIYVTVSPLSALTERQMQFWEDVDDGLRDIENFYLKKNQNIDRIRTFSKT